MIRTPTTWDQAQLLSLRSAGRYADTVAMLEPLYQQLVASSGSADPETIVTGHWLALAYADAGRLDEAVNTGRQALEWGQKLYGDEDTDTLTTMSNLAIDLYNANQYGEAYDLLSRAFESRITVLGHDHVDTLWTGYWLALATAMCKSAAEALPLDREILDGERRVQGAEADATHAVQCNFGVDLVIADQHDEALIVLEEALGIGRRRYPDVTRTWWAARYLARAYGEIDRFAEAVEVAREVVDNYCRILGDDNPITNEARTDYGILLVRSGQPGFGAVLFEGVWHTARDGGRLDEPASLLAGQWLATAYAASGRMAEAIEVAREVFTRRQATLAPHDLDLLTSGSNLATYLVEDDPPGATAAVVWAQNKEAVDILEPNYQTRSATYGAEARETLRTGSVLARGYADVGRLVDAVRLGREILASEQRVLGPEDPETLVTASNLGTHLVQQGEAAEAIPILEATEDARSRVLGAEHSHTLLTGHWLAEAYAAVGRRDDALAVTSRVLDARRKVFGSEFPAVERTMRLVDRLQEGSEGSEGGASGVGVGDQGGDGAGTLSDLTSAPFAAPPGAPLDAALAELSALVGLAAVKVEIHGIVAEVQFNARREAAGKKARKSSHHMVFVGNPGTGKTTVARLVGRIFAALGILAGGQLIEADEEKLVAGYIGQTAPKTTAVFQSALGGVLFIDEAYALARRPDGFGQEAIDTLVKLMEDHREEVIVIVAGYPDRMADFIGANPGLPTRFNTTIVFEDYATSELLNILRNQCRDAEYTLAADVETRIGAYLDRLPRGDKFGNAREVRRLLDLAVKRHAAQHPDDLDHLVADDFPEAPGEQLGADRPSYDELLARLDAMVGLAPIKTRVKEMVAKARFDAERRRRGLPVDPPTIHLVFAGNPGTGKTTVARLLGELYASVGVLSRGHVVERSRAELVASYEGQTAPATKKAFEQAFGGILFVDEAYSLTRSGEHDPFGQEAVETLLKLMEDHRADAGVIVAGYTERMTEFLASNPGLASRFEQTIEFPDYSDEELVEIFARICADHQYEVSANVRRAAAQFFAAQPRDATFGNGRLARSLFEAAETRHSAVLADGKADDADFTTLQPADVLPPS